MQLHESSIQSPHVISSDDQVVEGAPGPRGSPCDRRHKRIPSNIMQNIKNNLKDLY